VPLDNEVSVDGQVMKVRELEKEIPGPGRKRKKKSRTRKWTRPELKKRNPANRRERPGALGFEYELQSGKLSLLKDYEPKPKRPRWASISPDRKWVVFARDHNLS